MSRLYDHDRSLYVDVPENEVTDLVKSGRYTFPAGVTIPVVGGDGQLYDLPSEDAYKAFTEYGNRWATPQDKAQWETEGKAAILQEHYGDNTGTALAAGVLRGATFAGSDAAIAAVAPELVEGLKATKDLNPIASAVGSVAGTVALGGVTGVLGASKAAAGLGEGAATALTAGLGTSRAARAIQTAAPAVLGGITEGAFQGGIEGVSEAVLGKPEDVAINLIANIGLGAAGGGVFGAALGGGAAAKPFLNEVSDAVTGGAQRLATGTARKLANKNIVATLNEAGEQRLAKEISDGGLILTDAGQEWREMAASGRWADIKKQVKDTKKLQVAMEKEAKGLEAGARVYLNTLPAAEKEIAEKAMMDAAYDAVAANKNLYNAVQEADGIIRTQTDSLIGPRVYDDNLADTLQAYAAKARKTGHPESVIHADMIDAAIKRNLPTARTNVTHNEQPLDDILAKFTGEEGVVPGALPELAPTTTIAGALTEGAEIAGLREIKQALDYAKASKIGNNTAQKAFIDLHNVVKQALEEHPREFVADSFKTFNPLYTAMMGLRDVIGTKTAKQGTIRKLLQDPYMADSTTAFITKLEEFAPELAKFDEAVKGSKAAADAYDLIKARIKTGRADSPTGVLSMDDMRGLIKEFNLTKGNIAARLDRYASIRGTLDGLENLSPLEAAARLEKAVHGKTDLEQYIPNEAMYNASDTLRGMKGDPDVNMKRHLVRAGVGTIIGGPMGAVAGFAAVRPSVASTMKMLNTIERASYKGAQAMNAAVRGTVDALTGETAKRVTRAAAGRIWDRDNYNDMKKKISELASPDALLAHASSMNAEIAPQLHGAIVAKISTAANYLQQTMPVDRLAAHTLNPAKSNFKPSDAEISKWMRRAEVANNPLVAIERIKEGTVTPEQIDALKVCHPEVFGRLQTELIRGIMSSEKTPAYANRLILKQVFGIPTDYSLQSTFIASMQSIHAPPEDEGGRPNEGANGTSAREQSRKPVDVKPMEYMTEAQKNEVPN